MSEIQHPNREQSPKEWETFREASRRRRVEDATPKTDEEKRIRKEALETFSFAKASSLVGPVGEIQFVAWDALRLLDDVRVSAFYAAKAPPFDWRDPLERSIEKDLDDERPVARLEVSSRMVAVRKRLRYLRGLVEKTLVEEAIP